MKLSDKTDQELKDIISAVLREQNLRRKLDASPEKIDQVVRQYQVESGVKDGDPWEYPGSSLLRPMKGARRTHGGKLWRSTIDHNVWEPGVSGWKLVAEVDEDGNEVPPPFNRPSGAHDAYEAGDRITWTDGQVYEAVRDGVDWDPGNAPQDWVLVEEEPPGDGEDTDVPPEDGEETVEPPEGEEPDPEEPTDPEEPEPGDGEGGEDDEPTEPEPGEGDEEPVDPDPEPDPEPEPEPEPGTIDNPHTWEANVDYEADHYVTYNGALYRVQQAHTSAAHWTPDAVASLYERQ